MRKILDYNIYKYMNSVVGVTKVNLESIICKYDKCKKYTLSPEVADYLRYIEKEPFYISPSFADVKTDKRVSTLNSKFVLFSAPGATGKTALAEHIAYRFDAIYWNLAKVKIGSNSFAGSILNAVGALKYSDFISDMNAGKVLLVLDAFDEAEIISGRKMLSSFLADISNSLSSQQIPVVILLARTGTAQYIASFCAENEIPISHYEIGFFDANSAKDFIIKKAIKDREPTRPEIECVRSYYEVVSRNIAQSERTSFLGYAPVLEAIARHIQLAHNPQKMIGELSNQKDCISVITNIMEDLLKREQEDKVVQAFVEKCESSNPEFTEWGKVYSSEEQLVRVIYYILFRDTAFSNYPLDFLPPQLIDDYQEVLDSFLPQHPFVRDSVENVFSRNEIDFTGPAFRDYVLAKIILNTKFETLADMYFEESQSQYYFPSQIFFDCYSNISNNLIQPNHLSYMYDSFKAKATAYETPYLYCSEISPAKEEVICTAEFGMAVKDHHQMVHEEVLMQIQITDTPLRFGQLVNVSLDVPSFVVAIGRAGVDTRIYNSSVVCKQICFDTQNVTIESYFPESCLLISKENFLGNIVIDIARADDLKVSAPNINSYYKLISYRYDFEDESCVDIIKFIHALRGILSEFRTHRKDVLAKFADRIEHVTVGNSSIKRQVLEYLLDCAILYREGRFYKVNENNMQNKGIHFDALLRMDTQRLSMIFKDFNRWVKERT